MPSGVPSKYREENATWKKLRNMHLPVPTMQEPLPLSISTRGIGLALSESVSMMKRLCREYDSDDGELLREVYFPIASMYRASLVQLEAKVYIAKVNQSGPLSVRSATDASLFGPAKTFPKTFFDNYYYNENISTLALIINSIGHVEVNGKHFEPTFLRKPSPLNIRITNLRKYCVDMSNLDTDSSERVAGYELNSIPNAEWEFADTEDPQSVYLANPDEIIPADYDDNSMNRDFNQLHTCLFSFSSEKRHLIGSIKYKECGDPAILASTKAVRRTNSDIEFWSREHIQPLSWTVGAITLAGEISDQAMISQRSKVFAVETKFMNRERAVRFYMPLYPPEN